MFRPQGSPTTFHPAVRLALAEVGARTIGHQFAFEAVDDVAEVREHRDMRAGRIESSDGTKLAYVLAQLGKLIESSEIEKRLEAVEGVLVARKVRP